MGPADLVTFTEEILNGKLHFFAVLVRDHLFSLYENLSFPNKKFSIYYP